MVAAGTAHAALLVKFDFDDAGWGKYTTNPLEDPPGTPLPSAVPDDVAPNITAENMEIGAGGEWAPAASPGNPDGCVRLYRITAANEADALSNDDHFQFAFSSVYPINLVSITWDHSTGGGGNRRHAVYLSVDGGSNFEKLGATRPHVSGWTPASRTIDDKDGITDTIIFKFVGWGTANDNQDVRFDNIVVNGTLELPPPGTVISIR
jgi:hypothetical protein